MYFNVLFGESAVGRVEPYECEIIIIIINTVDVPADISRRLIRYPFERIDIRMEFAELKFFLFTYSILLLNSEYIKNLSGTNYHHMCVNKTQ